MKQYILSAVAILTLLTVSCSNDDDFQVPQNLEDHDFVWQAMNYWYFWQADVSNLADSKDNNDSDYVSFLSNYNDAEDLFDNLKNNTLDDFSWYIPDVDEQLNQFRGISVSYGIEMPRNVFSVDSNDSTNDDVYIYITYVVSGSPADIAGFERGDLIYKVNNETLNSSNFTILNDIISPNEGHSVSISVGKIENNTILHRLEATVNATQISENPLHHTSIIEEAGKKIGYLVYNSFRGTYNGELNDAFETLKAQNIDELVLDLRYNRGGSVLTSAYLASMIEGSKTDGSLFARLRYNSKRDADNGDLYSFSDKIALFNKSTGEYTGTKVPTNRLSTINTLYVITSNNTASASEMIINGLTPSMDVILVGLKTTGKNEGSNTLVDATKTKDTDAFLNIEGRRSNIGLQPITFQIYNSLDQSDYTDGFVPDNNKMIDELDYSDTILPFGDTNEALLRKTLDVISEIITKEALKKSTNLRLPSARLEEKKFDDEMYILPDEKKFMNLEL